MPLLSPSLFATVSLLFFSFHPSSADSASVPTFTYGHFSDIYPSGYTPPPSPTLTGIFASEASIESVAASKASATTATTATSNRPSYGEESPKNLYLDSMCQPISDNGVPDQAFPCNRAVTLVSTCVFGEEYAKNATMAIAPPSPPPEERSPADQQRCLCPGGKGQDYFQYYEGCNKCLELHGGATKNARGDDFQFYPTGLINSVSSDYCALATPTQRYLSYINDYIMTGTITYGTETGVVDKLSSKTDVGLYFTSTQVKALAATTSTIRDATSPKPATTTAIATTVATTTAITSSASASSTAGADSLKVPGFLGAGILGIVLAL